MVLSLKGWIPATIDSVLNIRKRIIQGKFDLGTGEEDLPLALIGKGVAEKFHLHVGDELKAVIPLSGELDRSAFRPKLGKFRVAGVPFRAL